MSNLVLLQDETILNQLSDHIRVNTSTKAVEIYDEFGVRMVLRNLPENAYEAFKAKFQNF